MIRAASGELLRCNASSVCKSLRWLTAVAAAAGAVLLSSCSGSAGGSSSGFAGYIYLASARALTLYSVDAYTGGLGAALATPVTDASGGISQIATHPSGQFLYLLTQDSGVHVYSIDSGTGALAEVAGSPFASGVGTLAFDASGTHVYFLITPAPIAPVTTTISAYSIDPSGALTALASYTIPTFVSDIVIVGSHLYAVDFSNNSIIAFSIGSTGELSENVPGSPFATDMGPGVIVANPSGTVLYSANSGKPTATSAAPGSISAFTIDASTGALSPAPGNPLAIPVNGAFTIDPQGKFLFVGIQAAGAQGGTVGVSVYTIDTETAALSAVAGSPFSAGSNPSVAIIDPTDRVVYIFDQGSSQVTELSLASTGTLTPLPGSPAVVGAIPYDLAFVSP